MKTDFDFQAIENGKAIAFILNHKSHNYRVVVSREHLSDQLVSDANHDARVNYVKDNIEHIRDKNILWVMGSDDPTNKLEEKWKLLLNQIGVEDSNIKVIDLEEE